MRKGKPILCEKCGYEISSFYYKQHHVKCDGSGPRRVQPLKGRDGQAWHAKLASEGKSASGWNKGLTSEDPRVMKQIKTSRENGNSLDWEDLLDQWERGEILVEEVRTEASWSKHIRGRLLKKAGNKCTQCGWDAINPVSKRCPLEMDHIDGNPRNNTPGNLRILCPNCHSLTPTHRWLNARGSGRRSLGKSSS
jgi:predicted Zn-ribbon and HTH transcriptional regulator